MKMNSRKIIVFAISIALVCTGVFLTGCSMPKSTVDSDPVPSASEISRVSKAETILEIDNKTETESDSTAEAESIADVFSEAVTTEIDIYETVTDKNSTSIDEYVEDSNEETPEIIETTEPVEFAEEFDKDEPIVNEDKDALEDPHPDISSEDEKSYQVHVNLASGGGEIPLDENGNYIGGSVDIPDEEGYEQTEQNEDSPQLVYNKEYSSLEEIDTSKLIIGSTVIVNGKQYAYFGEMVDDPYGFMEVTSNGGRHIVANIGPLSGNIIGY